MAVDVNKHLDRAKRFLEKNRVEDAIAAYLAVLDEVPQHQEATQALGDLYARMEQPDLAAVYYGLLFDMLVDPRDENKALAIYNRFLRSGTVQQPPERIARYAFLQQKQNHADEAIEQYTKAAELFSLESRAKKTRCFAWSASRSSIRKIRSGNCGWRKRRRKFRSNALAARAFLRAGQLATARQRACRRAEVAAPRVLAGSAGAQRGAVVCGSEIAGRATRAKRWHSGSVFRNRK